MSGPPPPFRSKASVSKAARHRANQNQFEERSQFPPITSGAALLNEEPDMVVGESVKLKGNLRFESLLRIDGGVIGHLVAPSEAGLIIGVNGSVKGNILNISTVLIEGKVIGNIKVESLSLRATAIVHGDITCKSLESHPTSTVVGQIHVHPFDLPPFIDKRGNLTKKPTPAGERERDDSDDEDVPTFEEGLDYFHNKEIEKVEIEAKPEKKNSLLLIDPQNDFHYGGACAVPCADEDSEKVSEMILRNIDKIDEIFVTLDTHHRMHIAHGIFWKNEMDDPPPPFTVITVEDVNSGVWVPRDLVLKDHCISYIQELAKHPREDLRKLIIKAEHCLIGTKGHGINPKINEALREWAGQRLRKIGFVMKGTNCLTDMNSAFQADVEIESDPSTSMDTHLIGRLMQSDKLIICGASMSTALNFTVRDVIQHWTADVGKMVLVRDGIVGGIDQHTAHEKILADKFWEYVKKTGVKCCRSPEVFLEAEN